MKNWKNFLNAGWWKASTQAQSLTKNSPSAETYPRPRQDSLPSLFAKKEPAERIIPGSFLTRIAVRDQEEIRSELRIVEREYAQLKDGYDAKRANLLPIETQVQHELQKQYQPELDLLSRQIGAIKREEAEWSLNSRFFVVDIDFLKQAKTVDGCELPKYAVFDSENSVMSLSTRAYANLQEESSYVSVAPDCARNLVDGRGLWHFGKRFLEQEQRREYEETKRAQAIEDRERSFHRQRIEARVFSSTDVSIAARFSALLPFEVRETIASNVDNFEKLIIVTEAPEWLIRCRERAIAADVTSKKLSLIGKKGDRYWLVAEAMAV